MSKREGAQGVAAFRDAGYLPDALVNYLARLGWSHGDQEVFSRDELIRLFDIADVNRAAAVFDNEKLTWLNQHYIQGADAESLREPLRRELERIGLDPARGPDIGLVVEVQRDRARTLVDMAEKSVFAYRDFDAYDEGAAKKHLRPVALEPLLAVRERLAALDAWESEATACRGGGYGRDPRPQARPPRAAPAGRAHRYRHVALHRENPAAGRPRAQSRPNRCRLRPGARPGDAFLTDARGLP